MTQHRVAVVTGSSAGIGRETARSLASLGYEVVVVGRNPERTEAAAQYVREHGHGAPVTSLTADFSSLADVRTLAEQLLARLPAIHVLVNNAGLWHSERRLSADGFEDTFAVNHLAPFLLTNLLLERMKASAPARIVHVSSRLHEKQRGLDFADLERQRRYKGLHVYAQTKLANVMFSNELARRLQDSGVTSNAVHPGDVVSDIVREQPLLRLGGKLVARFFDSPEQASRTSVYVATDPQLGAVSGRYFKKCKPHTAAAASHDRAARGRLWALSEQAVDL
jgi:retinol dehydrogenase-14